ncbi:MAG TPA: TIGR03435 family protein [Acidobacteriaceae bacterium]
MLKNPAKFLLESTLLLITAAPAQQSANIATTTQNPHPTFEVASVKPAPPEADPNTGSWSIPSTGRFTATHVSLALLIQLAYDIDKSQIANEPGWLDTNLYDIVAKPEDGIRLTRDELRPRLQDLLHQRFHLIAHTETRLSRGYALVIANGGPHLTPTKADHFPGFRINVSSGQIRGANWSMPQLAKYLTPAASFPVVDQTGLTGSYDIAFSYNPKPQSDSTLPLLDVALKQTTGLLLKSQKVPVETVVIDSVDKMPTAD